MVRSLRRRHAIVCATALAATAAVAPVSASTLSASHPHRGHTIPGSINPSVGAVTIAGPDGNPVIDPATGQPLLVDAGSLPEAPAHPGDKVIRLPSPPGTESYLVPSYLARDEIAGTRP